MAHTSPLALWKWLHRNAHQLEQRWEAWRFQRRRRLGRIKPVHIVPFLGYGNASKAVLGGRVLEKKPLGRPREDAPWWENVRAMIQRWARAEIPHVRLAARCNGQGVETTTDEEGYFTVEFALQDQPVRGPGWHDVEIELLEAVVPGQEAVTATGQVLIPPAQPDLMIVSDIDDTILKTDAMDFFRMRRVTLLNNVHTRVPFAGVPRSIRRFTTGRTGRRKIPCFISPAASGICMTCCWIFWIYTRFRAARGCDGILDSMRTNSSKPTMSISWRSSNRYCTFIQRAGVV